MVWLINMKYYCNFDSKLLAVKDADGNAVERYAYDKAGNMLKKTLRIGRGDSPSRPQYQTTTFTFDDANQLVSSTTDGVTTRYAYDAAGRLVKEGNKTYRYGYLDKVLSVTDGDTTRTYTYHADGQLASATVGSALRADRGATPLSETETFLWDGLALIQRGEEQFMNEPHVGGGNPVASSKGTSYFNDALGTTVGAKKDGKYSAAALTAFGESFADTSNIKHQTSNSETFFTGKPYVEGLGHAFLMRNYRAGLAKWQTADPMGYPNGWNALAYCGNMPQLTCDYLGCAWWNPLDWISWLFDSDDEKYIKDTKFEELSCSVLDTHHVSLVCGLGSEGKWKWTPSVTWAYNAELGLHPMGIGDLNIKVNVKSQESLEYTIPAYKCSSKKHDFSGTLDYDLEVRFTVAKCIVTYSDGSTEEKLVGDYQIMAVNLKHKDCE